MPRLCLDLEGEGIQGRSRGSDSAQLGVVEIRDEVQQVDIASVVCARHANQRSGATQDIARRTPQGVLHLLLRFVL